MLEDFSDVLTLVKILLVVLKISGSCLKLRLLAPQQLPPGSHCCLQVVGYLCEIVAVIDEVGGVHPVSRSLDVTLLMVEHSLNGPVGNSLARFARPVARPVVGQPRTCQPFLWAESESGEEEDGEGDTGQQDGGCSKVEVV